MLKPFLTPRWLGLHTLFVAALVALGWLGWWQLESARAQDDWQNYGYALQWWLFGGFAVFLWGKLIFDELDPKDVEEPAPESPVMARQVPPAVATADDDDDELDAYNRHLAWLAERSDR